jgi:hypothetical protein
MLLRELFEAKGNPTVGIIFGRFNPAHKGHRAAWEMAAQNDHWFVGTNKSTEGPKDPLPFKVKVEVMKAIWPEIDGHIIAEQSWLTMASKIFSKYGNVILNVYTDEDWVTKTLLQYNGKESAHGFYNFSSIQQQPTPRLSSATALRTAVVNGDKQAFSDAAGVDADTEVAGQSFFDLVSHYLMPYQNAPKKPAAKKKVKEPAKQDVEEGVADKIVAMGKSARDTFDKTVSSIPKPFDEKEVANDLGIKGQAAQTLQTPNAVRWSKTDPKLNKKPVPEEAAGVGTITKQNSTVDVNKGTPRKNLKAFKLI